MIHCLALARDQPLNNVYHCLPGLFNYLANIIAITARALCFMILKGCWVANHKYELEEIKPVFRLFYLTNKKRSSGTLGMCVQ